MTRALSKRDLMRASAMIQNPMIQAKKVTPDMVRRPNQAVTSAFTQAAVPDDAREVQGMSGGVMKAERTAQEVKNA